MRTHYRWRDVVLIEGTGLKILYILASFAVSFGATSAASEIYRCDLDSHSHVGWIPNEIVLEIAPDRKSAEAYDDYIHKSYGKPIKVGFSQSSARTYQFIWEVRKRTGAESGAHNAAQYRALLNFKTGKIIYTAVPAENGNSSPQGEGKCIRQK
ncbi:hypothetical protein [Arenibacterium sp. CAU 1754]